MTTTLLPGTRYPRFLDDFRREVESVMGRFLGSEDSSGQEFYTPLCNVAENETQYDISVDLPGVGLEDVEVEYRNGELWITGERKFEAPEGWTWHRLEVPRGRFQRVIRLASDIDAEKIDAEFRNGVLHVVVPKSEAAKPKHIEIRS